MLTMKPPVSSSKMKDITKAGMRAQKYYKHVVLSVEKLIQKSKPDYKLSGVYVIDAIVRQSRHQNTPEKDNYGPRFQNSLTTTVTNLFKCSRSDQVKISRTLKLWEMNGVFSVDVVAKCLSLTDSSIRNEGIKLAESVKASGPANPAKKELLKQKLELEEQQKQIMAQQKQLAKQQAALLKQSSTLNLSTIPPILGNLLQFGANKSGDAIPGFGNDKETVNKVKQLLDDFDYGDDDEIKVPAKQDKNGAKTPPAKDQLHELNTPSPTAPIHNDSLYSSGKEDEKQRKGDKRSSSKKRHRSRSRERDGVKSKDKSKERSKSDKKDKKVDDKKNKSRSRGKRSRSASPSHVKDKKVKEEERYNKLECVTILSTTIWIGNLRKTVTKDDIATLMKKYGKTDSINMVPPRGCVYVCVKDRDTAREALKDWKGLKLHGAACKIAWAPGKGCKDYKHYWDVENGVTYIPHREFERLKFSSLEEGGVIDPESLPAGYTRREEAAPDQAEGPGSILEKLLVSMRGKKETQDTPFSQFIDKPNTAQQEQNISSKLDLLDQLNIPSKSTPSDLEEDSIVHLLNSKDYTLSEAISGSHSPAASETCMSPLENLLPEGVTLEEVQEANKTIEPKVEPNEHVYSPEPQMTPEVKPVETVISPVKPPNTLPLTPVKTPSHDTGDHTPTAETPDTPGKDKKAINLQTYLKRKRDDDPEEEIKEETLKGDVRAETPPPVSTRDNSDDLLEWVTNQEEEEVVKEEELKRDSSYSSVKRSESDKVSDKENEVIDDGIRSPESSPVDSLLEEKLASPSVLKEDTPPLKRSPKSSSSRSSPTKKAKLSKIINSPTVTSSDTITKPSPGKPLDSSLEQLKLDYDASDNDISDKKEKMKSSVSTKVSSKKEKKHKVKSKKKKKASSRDMEEELEEDIRRLEFLKAELEKEEKKERREEKRKEREKRARIASRSPSRHSREKKKKEKRTRR